MSDILTAVVEKGTGKAAALRGYRVAGKTGTAQKAVPGGYSKTDFIASFVGFAPALRPELTALVILDSPEGDHSGSRAAAVFARIVERSLVHLGVPRDEEEVVRVAKVWPQTAPILSIEASASSAVRPAAFATPEGPGAPDVVGLSARDALARFVASGLMPDLAGTGFVVEQSPAGGRVARGGHRGPSGSWTETSRPPRRLRLRARRRERSGWREPPVR